jgi:hypothetical protein
LAVLAALAVAWVLGPWAGVAAARGPGKTAPARTTALELAMRGHGHAVSLLASRPSGSSPFTQLWVLGSRSATPLGTMPRGGRSPEPGSLRFAVGRRGHVAALWSRDDRVIGRARWYCALLSRTGWQPAEELDTGGRDVVDADVAVDDHAAVTVVWTVAERIHGNWHNRVQALTRPAGSGFSVAEDLSAPGAEALMATVTAGSDGAAVAAWTVYAHGDTRIELARRTGAEVAFEPAVTVPRTGASPREARVGVDDRGEVVLAWLCRAGDRMRVRALRQRPGGAFGQPRTLSRRGAGELDVAVNGRGGAAVVWRRSDGRRSHVEATVAPPRRTFASAQAISQSGPAPLAPEAWMSESGLTVVVWSRLTPKGARPLIEASVRRPGGHFTRPVQVGRSSARR